MHSIVPLVRWPAKHIAVEERTWAENRRQLLTAFRRTVGRATEGHVTANLVPGDVPRGAPSEEVLPASLPAPA